MPQYLVAIHHPHNYDGSKEDAAMGRAIDALNDEMEAAGVRAFAGGLKQTAKSLRAAPDGKVVVTDGLYLKGDEHVGGFWILKCADEAEAIEWGKKAVIACRAPVEVCAFYGSADEARTS